MRQKQQNRPAKAIALFGVLFLHAVLLGYALRMRPGRALAFAPETFMELCRFDPARPSVSDVTVTPVTQRAVATPNIRANDRAISVQSITAVPAEKPKRIDWNEQAKDAATAVLQNRTDRELKESQFAPRQPLSGFAAKGKLDPGWREYRFRGHGRVETQSGLPILHLNDRCVLVAFVIPTCILGKMKPGDEMYEHMKEWEKHRGEAELP